MANKNKSNEKPKSAMIPMIIAMLVLTVAASGSGWFLGSNFLHGSTQPGKMNSAKEVTKPETDPHDEKKKDESKDSAQNDSQDAGLQVIKLDPIIVALKGNSNVWLRLELSIVADISAHLDEAPVVATMSNDIAAFLRTISLLQISGPSGYLHLREDLLDRVRLVTHNKATDLLITTMVFE